jgi:hypothetical protein
MWPMGLIGLMGYHRMSPISGIGPIGSHHPARPIASRFRYTETQSPLLAALIAQALDLPQNFRFFVFR